MFDRGKILIGLGVFLVLVLLPLWYVLARGGANDLPELDRKTTGRTCMRDTEWMRASHMDLLDAWRNDVVRGTGPMFDVDVEGTRHAKSLTGTCLGCHTNQGGFCDRCHQSMGVSPNCWDCHNVPGES